MPGERAGAASSGVRQARYSLMRGPGTGLRQPARYGHFALVLGWLVGARGCHGPAGRTGRAAAALV